MRTMTIMDRALYWGIAIGIVLVCSIEWFMP